MEESLHSFREDIPHGISKYNNDRCRCDLCKIAKAAYQREYRKRRMSEEDRENKEQKIKVEKSAELTKTTFSRNKTSSYKVKIDVWSLEVVSTDQLAGVIRGWKLASGKDNITIARRAEIDESTVRKILRGRSRFTSLRMADVILSAIDETNALFDGTIHIVPNPRFTQERWQRLMEERGCY